MNFTFYANPSLSLVCVPAGASNLYSLAAAARLTGVHEEMLRYYCRLGLIDARGNELESEPIFDEDALHEVRRIEHYRRHLGVSRRALPLVCELRRAGERQNIEFQFLRCP